MKRLRHIALCALAALAALGAQAAGTPRRLVVDKPAFRLYVIEGADTVHTYRVCVGENFGQKQRAGDCRTPEGQFKIVSIENASGWPYRPKDGRPVQWGCYGPWFMRLNCPQTRSIGIHGTRVPQSIGTRASEGCIRLRNEDLERLKAQCYVGMPVTVLPDRPAGLRARSEQALRRHSEASRKVKAQPLEAVPASGPDTARALVSRRPSATNAAGTIPSDRPARPPKKK